MASGQQVILVALGGEGASFSGCKAGDDVVGIAAISLRMATTITFMDQVSLFGCLDLIRSVLVLAVGDSGNITIQKIIAVFVRVMQ
jgi:hypothetical protein